MKLAVAPLIALSVVLGVTQAAAQDAPPQAAPPALPPAVFVSPPLSPAVYVPSPLEDEEPPPFEEPLPRPSRFSFKIDGGFRYAALYSSHVMSAELEAAIGARKGDDRVDSLYGYLQASLGSSTFGLSTRRYSAGFFWERSFDRLRLGAGVGLCLWDMSRVTVSSSMWAVGLAPRLGGSVDLARTAEDHALYLDLRGALDVYILNASGGDGPALAPALTLGVGYRY